VPTAAIKIKDLIQFPQNIAIVGIATHNNQIVNML